MLVVMLHLHAIAFLVLVNGKCLRMISLYGKLKDCALVGMVLIGRTQQGTPGAEKKRFQWIRENILFPFINWGRKEYDDFDVDSGAPMGDKLTLTAVSWCDGDHSQIDTIVSPDGIHRYSANPKFIKTSDVAHLKNPRGGKSIEEAKCGVDNCISVAFGVRNEKSRLLTITYLHDDTNVIGAEISAPLISRISLHGNSTEIKPSDILQNKSKVQLLLSMFDPKGKLSTQDFHDAMTDATSDILPKADFLFAMLKVCFQTHIKRKVKLADKQVPILGQQESCTCGSMDDCCIPSQRRYIVLG
jgi:hypothetical protein